MFLLVPLEIAIVVEVSRALVELSTIVIIELLSRSYLIGLAHTHFSLSRGLFLVALFLFLIHHGLRRNDWFFFWFTDRALPTLIEGDFGSAVAFDALETFVPLASATCDLDASPLAVVYQTDRAPCLVVGCLFFFPIFLRLRFY